MQCVRVCVYTYNIFLYALHTQKKKRINKTSTGVPLSGLALSQVKNKFSVCGDLRNHLAEHRKKK